MYNIDALHTTPLGQQRIKDNLRLNDEDDKEVVEYCKAAIRQTPATASQRKGKNWYVDCGEFTITINASANSIITAHKNKR